MSRLTFLYGLGDVASQYGVDESIFLHVLVSLVRNNKDNNRNFRDGRWWTYNSLSAWEAAFPWWTTKQIRRVLSSCKDQGAMLIGEYNKDRRDRTAWYSPSDELLQFYREDWTGKCLCPDGQMHEPERAGYCAQMGTTIPKESQSNSTNILAHLEEIEKIISQIAVGDDDRAATVSVISALEDSGFVCQNEVPVPSRGDAPKYTGRIGIVATKNGRVIAIEIDRKNIRKKTVHKLCGYSCDGRIVLLRGGGCVESPEGIDAVFPLQLKKADDYFHEFWDEYPKKEDKQRAFEVFKRLNVTQEMLVVMLQALQKQKCSEQWVKEKGKYVPYAKTWLNGRRWEDEDKPLPAGVAGAVPSAPPLTPERFGWD